MWEFGSCNVEIGSPLEVARVVVTFAVMRPSSLINTPLQRGD